MEKQDERKDDALARISDRARLLYAELESRANGLWCWCGREELVKVLGWSVRKVDYALKELIENGLVSRVREGDACGYRLEEEGLMGGKPKQQEGIKVKEPPAAKELVAHFVKLRFAGQTITPPMWRRLLGEATRDLKNYELEDLKACITWLHTERWWSKQSWSLSAAAGNGMVQYMNWKKRQAKVPGNADSQQSDEPTLGFVSMLPNNLKSS